MSSTKPEVRNLLLCRQRRTDSELKLTRIEKSGEIWTCAFLDMRADRQKDRQMNRQTDIQTRYTTNPTGREETRDSFMK